MNIEMDSVQFRQFTKDCMDIGRQDMAVQLGLVTDSISQRQARLKYPTRFDLWVKRGLITGNKQGGETSPRYFSRIELEILDKSETYEK